MTVIYLAVTYGAADAKPAPNAHPRRSETEVGTVCSHNPACPTTEACDRTAARVASGHPEQSWNPVCDGAIVFDDTGELLPDGCSIHPRRCAIHPRRPAGLLTMAPDHVVFAS